MTVDNSCPNCGRQVGFFRAAATIVAAPARAAKRLLRTTGTPQWSPVNPAAAAVAELISAEQARARTLHPNNHTGHPQHSDLSRLPLLVEEVGEVAEALQGGDREALLDEIVQVAAVAAAWAETLLSEDSEPSPGR